MSNTRYIFSIAIISLALASVAFAEEIDTTQPATAPHPMTRDEGGMSGMMEMMRMMQRMGPAMEHCSEIMTAMESQPYSALRGEHTQQGNG